ncbi:hypothetical protein D3C79_568130 [compost metagenome]
MHQGYSVENALYDPQLVDLEQIQARRAPPDTAVSFQAFACRLEPGFHLAESVRPIDQALPIAALFQGEAHRCAADVELGVPIVFLGVPALDQFLAEPAVEFQVGAGRCGGIAVCRRGQLAPVIEQVVVDVFDVHTVATFFRPAANQHPRRVLVGVELVLSAPGRRALALAHVLGTGHVSQPVVALQALAYFREQLVLHGVGSGHCARSVAATANCCSSALRVRLMPDRWGTSARTFVPRSPVGTFRYRSEYQTSAIVRLNWLLSHCR